MTASAPDRVRLLFVDHSPVLGGAENYLLMLLERMDRTRWEMHLAGVAGDLLDRAADLGIAVHPAPLVRLRRSAAFPYRWLRGTRSLARLVRRLGIDVLHANTVRAAFYAAPASVVTGTPFVWHMHDFFLTEEAPRTAVLDRFGKRVLLACARSVLACSRAVAAALPACDRVTVVPNGIDIGAFATPTDPDTFRKRFGIPDAAPLVGSVARLRAWKGHHRFLRVAARVREAVPAARFVIAGGDLTDSRSAYPLKLRQLARELGIHRQVVFTGHLRDVRPLFGALDVVVQAGDPEPFGLVNLEAMAAGAVIAGFAHGALPEIVQDDVTGLLVRPCDETGLVEAVTRLLKRPDHRTRLAEAARVRVTGEFGIERTVHEVSERLVQAAGRKRGA